MQAKPHLLCSINMAAGDERLREAGELGWFKARKDEASLSVNCAGTGTHVGLAQPRVTDPLLWRADGKWELEIVTGVTVQLVHDFVRQFSNNDILPCSCSYSYCNHSCGYHTTSQEHSLQLTRR